MKFKAAGNSFKLRISRKVFMGVMLVFAFTLIFGMAFTGILDFDLGGTGAEQEIALADRSGGGTTLLNVNPTIEQYLGETTASNYNDVFTYSFFESGSYTLDSSSSGNISYYRSTGSGTNVAVNVAGDGFTYVEDDRHMLYSPNYYVVINTRITSSYLKTLLSNGLATASARLTFSFNYTGSSTAVVGDGTFDFGSKIQQGTGAIHANSQPDAGSLTEYSEGEGGDYTKTCAIELSKFSGDSTILNLIFKGSIGTNAQVIFGITQMQLSIIASFPLESARPKMIYNTSSNLPNIYNKVTSISQLPVNFDAATYQQFPELQSALTDALDSAVPAASPEQQHTSNINMLSYRRQSMGTINGQTYYKRVNLTFNDFYGAGTIDETGSASATGLRRIEIGDSPTGIFYVYSGSSYNTSIINDSEIVGYVQFSRQNKSKVTASVYFYTNTNLQITVVDFAGNANMTEVVVSGIDTVAPDAPSATTDNYIIGAPFSPSPSEYEYAYEQLTWWNAVNMFLEIDALSADSGEAMIVYFYNVSFSRTGAFGTFIDLGGQTNNEPSDPATYGRVFAVGNATGLTLNFPELFGSGYYIIGFRAKDLAGNVSTYTYETQYFVKVDCDSPAYTVELVKGEDTPYESGTWATDQITATLTVTSRANSEYGYHSEINLSGNTLAYTGSDEREHYIVTFGGVITSSDPFGTLYNAGTPSAYYFDGTLTISYSHGVYTIVCGDKSYIESGITKYYEVDFAALFSVYIGPSMDSEFYYPSFADVLSDDPTIIFRSDRNAPMTPIIADEQFSKLSPFYYVDTDIPVEERDWFTEAWNMLVATQFSDDLMSTHGGNIRIYIGVCVNSFATEFSPETVLAEYLAGGYASYDACLAAQGYFDSVQNISSLTVDGGGDILLNLLQGKGSGLRTIYVWAVDQAMNTSSAESYQVLVDANTYRIQPVIDAATVSHFSGRTVASIEYYNQDGQTVTTYKRGDKLFINIYLTEGFIPYKIALTLDGAFEAEVYNNPTLDAFYSDEENGTFVMDELNLEHTVDPLDISVSPSTLYQRFVFSFRKIVTLSLGNAVVFYNGAVNPMSYVVGVPEGEMLPGFPTSDHAEFVGIYYTEYTDAENFALTGAANGALTDGSAPKNVGLYYVEAKVDGQFYISETLFSSYRINKLTVNLSAVASSSSYGDEVSLSAVLAAVGDDEGNIPDPVSGSLKLQGVPSLDNVPAGVYHIVVDQAFVYENYNVVFISAQYTVNPKEVFITVTAAQTKQYGDADPQILYTVDEGQTFVDGIEEIILGGGVLREQGENVTAGGYAYSASQAGFSVNPNYVLVIASSDNFMIYKREIEILPVEGQTAVIDTEFTILYELNGSDRVYAQYISGTLAIDGVPAVGSNAISLGTLIILPEMADNLELVLTGGTITLIALGDVVITVASYDGMSVTYGDACPEDETSDMFDFSEQRFAVSGLEAYAYYSISWTWTISGYSAGSPVGAYAVDIVPIVIMAGDDQETASDITETVDVSIGSVFLTVTPAVLTITLSNATFQKTYGGDEIDFQYEANSAVGTEVDWDITEGTFIRAIFDGEGNLVAQGTRFDPTNAALIGQYGAGYYYGVAVGYAFLCNDNFVIEYEGLAEIRCTVAPFAIELTANSFYGKSRAYNGSTLVGYSAGDLAIQFSKARAADSVSVNFTANYNTAEAGMGRTIVFTQLSLTGASALNYALYYDGVLVDGETSVSITKLSPESEQNDIEIYKAELDLLKADIKISKIFDGTTAISGDNIDFLRGMLMDIPKSSISVSGAYPQRNAGQNLSVSVTISIDLYNASGNFTVIEGEESGISVLANVNGITIVATLPNAEILPKPLKLSDFEFTGVDKRYDKTATAAVDFEYADGALGAGDTKANVPVTFSAHFAKLEGDVYVNATDAGEWTVLLTSAGELTNSNYVLDIAPEDFEEYTSLTANILPTRLLLDITFNPNRQYDGTSAVSYTTDFRFTVFGDDPFDPADIAGLSFTLESVIMSLNGAENTQVMFQDAAKTIVKQHNVMLSGVEATAAPGISLANFVLIGHVYNSGTSGYESVAFELTDGALPDFELLEAAAMKRRELDIQPSAITINDKFYDATSAGTGSINKNLIGIIESERDFIGISFTVAFTGVDVNPSVKANISVVGIINEEAAGGVDYAVNYRLKDNVSVNAYGYAAIKHAPLTFDISLANKVYDGTRNAIISSYTLNGIIDSRDRGKYTMSYLFGAFASINAGNNVPGSAYGLVLSYNGYTSGTGSYMNYILTYDLTAAEWETLHGEAVASEAPNYYMTKTVEDVVTHYFTLETKQFSKLPAVSYDPEEHGFVYTIVIQGGTTYYYVDYIGSGEPIVLNGFEAAAGNISRKTVTVSASLTPSGQAILNKTYDGTTLFAGVEGVDYTVNISGIMMSDDVVIAAGGVSVAYDRATASVIPGDRVLVFSITGLSGDDADNYSFTGATAMISATIYRAPLSVGLEELTVNYGDSARSYSFTINDGVRDLIVQSGNLGYMGDHDGNPETPDQFIVLDQNFTLPTVNDLTNNFTNAGVYPLTLSGGNSNNYTFNFQTGNFSGPAAPEYGDAYNYTNVANIIIIQKVRLYAYAVDKYSDAANRYEYMRIFKGGNPAITIGYSAAPDSFVNGFKNGQTASGLAAAGLLVEPIASFRYFNTATGTWEQPVDVNAVVNAELGANLIYGVYFDTQNALARNYIILVKHIAQHAQEYPDDAAKEFLHLFVDELYITYASIEGVTVKNMTVAYDGNAKTIAVSGTLATDVVEVTAFRARLDNGTYVKDGEAIAAAQVKNAGVYIIDVTVSRPNYLDWTGSALITINPKSVGLTLGRLVVNYDGLAHSITQDRDVTVNEAAINKADITYIYRLNGQVQQDLPVNAGTYLVQAVFNPATATHTANASNYAYSVSPAVALIINPIIVHITVEKRQAIFDPYEYIGLEYEAVVDQAFGDYPLPDITVSYRDSYSDSATDYIYYAGNYSFTISTDTPNYQLVGHTFGVYIVGIDEVVEEAEQPRASAKVKEGSLIYANTELTYTVKPNNKTYGTLWAQVNSNVNAMGTFFKPLVTSGIVDIAMVINRGNISSRVQPSGEVLLTMELPKGTANGDALYVVTAEGKLKQLEYTYLGSGKIEVSTDYVGHFVFVKDGSFPWWFIGVICGAVALGGIIALIVVLDKKKKIRDAQLVTIGTNDDGSPIQITVKEKRERDKQAELERQAEAKRQEQLRIAAEQKRKEEEARRAAELEARPAIRQVMKAQAAEKVVLGKAVEAKKAVAADAEPVKPGVMKAIEIEPEPIAPAEVKRPIGGRPPAKPAPPQKPPAPNGAKPPAPPRPTPPPRPVGKPPAPPRPTPPPRPVGKPPKPDSPPNNSPPKS